MRPKLIALIAVSAVALAGCASSDPSVEPTATVTVTATPEPVQAKVSSDVPAESVEFVEEQFADFAELRAEMHAADKPDRNEVAESLHAFCDSGEPFNVSKTESLNENLETIADDTYCNLIETN